MEGSGSALWQGSVLAGILFWVLSSSYLNLTLKLRSFLQPFVTHYVQTGTPVLLQIQSYKGGFFDALFSMLSCVVSVPFYTAFLPLLFWSGHGQLARQMTLLMAFCDYIGICIKEYGNTFFQSLSSFALQWLLPPQTFNKKHPFIYTFDHNKW